MLRSFKPWQRMALCLAGTALSSVVATLPAYAAPSPASPCASLNSSAGSGAAATLSQAIGYTGPGTPLVLGIQATDVPANMLASGIATPAVCQVGVIISSNGNPAQSQITVALLLPEGSVGTNSTSTWNGRFLGTGNGGFAGAIAASTLLIGLAPSYAVSGQTYAVANTDLGDGNLEHCNTLYCGSKEGVATGAKAGGLYGNPAGIADFGYEATHLMTVAGKSLVSMFYGHAANYSYFHGCSTGGQQALMEAQRFPNDYNGILAGSPANNRTHLHIGSASFYETLHAPADGSGLLSAPALSLAHAAVLAQCAGTDGGYAGDNFLTLPASCKFDASSLLCNATNDSAPCTDPAAASCTCLVPNQVTSLNGAYRGALDNFGKVLYPGYERGVEDPNTMVIGEQEALSEPLFDSLDYWGFGPNFDWHSLFANTAKQGEGMLAAQIKAFDDTVEGGSTLAGLLNANNANLGNSGFVAAGGKLIMYAGYEDPLIPSASTIDYYNRVSSDHVHSGGAAPSSFLRLYMAPGLLHCNGGPGANAFGNLGPQLPPIPGIATFDVLGALTAWVENGQAPGSVIATKYNNDNQAQGVAFQRPLCPYPATAIYNTSKPWQLASSWTCKQAKLVENQSFSPGYGPQ